MKKFLTAISILIIIYQSGFSQILTPDRRINWKPGITEEFPEEREEFDVMDYGAIGDGQTDDTPAFINAIKAIPGSGAILFIPAGEYLIKKTLTIDKGVLIKGEGFERSRLFFDLGQQNKDCIQFVKFDRGNWTPVTAGYFKDSTKMVVENAACFREGDFVEIQQENDAVRMYTSPLWNASWAENAVGQIIRIEAIAGDTLILERPLFMNYRADLKPIARKLGMIMCPGVEDLYIERRDAGDGHTIQFRYVAFGRIRRIESNYTYRTHVYLSEAYACEIRQNYLHHSHDYGGGGHGYGVDLVRHCTDNLIIDNVFQHLRHSMMVHVGSSGNVYAYNFSTEREPQRLCDISLHGHFANFNLFESNVIEEIDIADYWGPMGPGNTFLRNRITQEGIDVNDQSHAQNLIGNVLVKAAISVKAGVQNTLKHGNVVRGKVQWDSNIEERAIPISYFLQEKPDFLTGYCWPFIGPDLDDEYKIPAQIRFERGNPVTGVNNQSVEKPTDFRLSAYPNPFNPVTNIAFELSSPAPVRIEIFTVLGQHVGTLADQRMEAGKHLFRFQPGEALSSGIYIVQFNISGRRHHLKITFLK